MSDPEVLRLFSENLKRHRKLADLSQETLSVMASVHRTEVSMLERAIRLPRIDTLIKIAASLGISAAELLEDITWESGSVKIGGFRLQDPEDEQTS